MVAQIMTSHFFGCFQRESPIQAPEMQSAFHPHAQRNVLPLLLCCYFSARHHRGSENMGAFTLITVAPRESVAFSFTVPNLSLKSFAPLFSVF
jgi:hypothetical protein